MIFAKGTRVHEGYGKECKAESWPAADSQIAFLLINMKGRLWTQMQPKASNPLMPHLRLLEPWPETWTNLLQVPGLQSILWCRTGSLARSEKSGFSLQVSFLQVNSRLMTEMHYHEKPTESVRRTDVMSKRNYYTHAVTIQGRDYYYFLKRGSWGVVVFYMQW